MFSDFNFVFFSNNFPELIENIDENYLKIGSFAFTFLINNYILFLVIGKST